MRAIIVMAISVIAGKNHLSPPAKGRLCGILAWLERRIIVLVLPTAKWLGGSADHSQLRALSRLRARRVRTHLEEGAGSTVIYAIIGHVPKVAMMTTTSFRSVNAGVQWPCVASSVCTIIARTLPQC